MTVYEKEKDMVSRRETVAVSFEKGSLGTCVEVAGSPFEGVYLPEEAYVLAFSWSGSAVRQSFPMYRQRTWPLCGT